MSDSDSKPALRAEAKARRAALSPEFRRNAAERVAVRTADLLGPLNDRVVAGYVAIRDELDPLPTLVRLAAAGARPALPAFVRRDGPLAFRAWRPGEMLVPGAFRIPEPPPDQPDLRPSILLVPLLAFDRRGHRLGWGAGCYDRTLAALRSSGRILAIGVAFSAQSVDRLPDAPEDQPLDVIVTETETILTSHETAR